MKLYQAILILLIIAGIFGTFGDNEERSMRFVFALITVSSSVALFITLAMPHIAR
ncbi:hypothetical protein ACFP7A_00900 [Sporolactobacillus kofuensis]|uniref:DUF1328 domain-containing protein n=1 Tax=Sporolactobacillus kofuensis TaxID=269672 RepID=A0ABW1WDE2_9BACL|nr:hypothetical protein [Sporolactobacillus kofuensis]MCO7175539.1 hypothetical protein [Sporolactobacillus kofuensis]